VKIDAKTEYAEVQFYFCLSVAGYEAAYALIRLYAPPEPEIYTKSYHTLYLTCQLSEEQGLRVVPVKNIKSVVAILPYDYKNTSTDAQWFVWECMGLDISMLQSSAIEDV
jgi:hypothetical protein